MHAAIRIIIFVYPGICVRCEWVNIRATAKYTKNESIFTLPGTDMDAFLYVLHLHRLHSPLFLLLQQTGSVLQGRTM